MSLTGRTRVAAAREFDREFGRLLDEMSRCGLLTLPGAADALLGAAVRGDGTPSKSAPSESRPAAQVLGPDR